MLPIKSGNAGTVSFDGSLVRESWGSPIAKLRGDAPAQTIQTGNLKIRASSNPLAFGISTLAGGIEIQIFSVDRGTGIVSFKTGESPLLGLGEGGPQFDRRGSIDTMVSGQGGYKLETHGGRVPIPWLISTAGWAVFFHQPFGTFDSYWNSNQVCADRSQDAAFPLDIFFAASP